MRSLSRFPGAVGRPLGVEADSVRFQELGIRTIARHGEHEIVLETLFAVGSLDTYEGLTDLEHGGTKVRGDLAVLDAVFDVGLDPVFDVLMDRFAAMNKRNAGSGPPQFESRDGG